MVCPYRKWVPIRSESLIQPSYTFLPDCIWVCSFSTTSPSWMTSCLILMPVSSVNALASVLDSYSCVVMVSDTTLISMPLKGWAAFSYHCNSFSWSAFDKVEGWNSLSIHFCAVASSARAGADIVTDAAISAAALVMVRKRVLVERPLLLKCRIMFPPLQRQNINPGPG